MAADMVDWKLAQSQMDIMLDGYISQTLTPLCTEQYMKIFMSCLDQEHGSLFVFKNQWVIARPSTTQQRKQRPATSSSKPGNCSNAIANKDLSPDDVYYEVFDCRVDLCRGTIVPQPSMIGLSKETGMLSPTFFIQHDGTLGVPYNYPSPKECTLYNENELATTVLKRESQNMRMHIQWPGYKRFQYEFRITDERLGKQEPIKMPRLVECVIQGIHHLFLKGKRDPDTFQSNEQWKLGDDDGIKPSELIIIGLIHISKGLVLPILQLNRHIIPRWDWEDSNQPVTEENKSDEDWGMHDGNQLDEEYSD